MSAVPSKRVSPDFVSFFLLKSFKWPPDWNVTLGSIHEVRKEIRINKPNKKQQMSLKPNSFGSAFSLSIALPYCMDIILACFPSSSSSWIINNVQKCYLFLRLRHKEQQNQVSSAYWWNPIPNLPSQPLRYSIWKNLLCLEQAVPKVSPRGLVQLINNNSLLPTRHGTTHCRTNCCSVV